MNTLKKSLLGASIALALGGGVAPETQAIQVAANGIGQVLLAPIYKAEKDGECTYLTVTNPSLTHAVKVKAVVRSKKNSIEVIDFIIYLTPGDVWRGEICNRGGQAWLHSEDDSMLNIHFPETEPPTPPAFASEDNPADIQLIDGAMLGRDPTDINEMGHIEFIGHYSVTGSINVIGETVKIECGMSKTDLRKVFELFVAGNENSLTALNPERCAGTNEYPGLSAPTCPARVDDGTVRLTGTADIVGTNQSRTSYKMTALASSRVFNRNVSNTTGLGQVPVLGIGAGGTSYHNAIRAATDDNGNLVKEDNAVGPFDEITGTHVIANGLLEVHVGQETRIGTNWGFNRGEIDDNPWLQMDDLNGDLNDSSVWFRQGKEAIRLNSVYDNILEIERALATAFVVDSYENGEVNGADRLTEIQLTFPTKYRHYQTDICGGLYSPHDEGNGWFTNVSRSYSPPFELNGCVRHDMYAIGNKECPGTYVPPEQEYSGPTSIIVDPDEHFICDEVWRSGPDLFTQESGRFSDHLFASASPSSDVVNCGGFYDGVPAIAYTYKYTSTDGGTTVTNPTLTPASQDNWAWQ